VILTLASLENPLFSQVSMSAAAAVTPAAAHRQTRAILHCPRVLAVWRARRLQGQSAAAQQRFLASLERWECLEQWPSRFLSGHFTAILAGKREQ